MSMKTYPLAVPDELLKAIKRAAKQTGLSQADTMRQAIKFGLPHLQQRLSDEDDMTAVIADTWEKLGPAPTVNWDAVEKR